MLSQSVTIPGWGILWALPATALVIIMLWGLANCLLGYAIFRISVVITGLFAGVWGGMYLVLKLKADNATGVDYLVACSVLAIIAGLVAWLLYQLCFAIMVALNVTCIMVYWVLANSGSTGAWIIGGMVGLATGGIALLFPRISIILITAMAGAVTSAAAVMIIIVGGDFEKILALFFEDGNLQWQIWLTIAIAVALTVAGVYVQTLLARNVRLVWAPPDNKKKKKQKGKSSRQR